MSQPEGEAHTSDTETAFAAGVAAATAVQASEEAEEANGAAEQAVDTSQAAVDIAATAAGTAEEAREDAAVTRAELDGVRSQLGALNDQLSEFITASSGAGEHTAPAPERKEAKSGDGGDAPPATAGESAPASGESKPRGYGSKRWFG